MTGSILIGVLTETKCIMKHLFCIIYFVVFFFVLSKMPWSLLKIFFAFVLDISHQSFCQMRDIQITCLSLRDYTLILS